jgi:predicted O-methyltransferase YrrM
MDLEALPREPCDTSRLGDLDAAGLAELLAGPGAAVSWALAHARVGPVAPPDGTGGVNPGDRRAIFTLVRALRPRRVLEIGTHIAASTASIAMALQGEGSLTTVDIVDVNHPATGRWKERGAKLSPRELMHRLGCASRVSFETAKALDFLARPQAPFDLIFLDGDHDATAVYREIPRALQRLAKDGHILLHDYCPDGKLLWPEEPAIEGPWLAVRRLLREGARLQVLPLGALPWPTKRSGNVTSLALLSYCGC